ncbi:flagellar biosynthetic protein FliO [Cellvibrio sp. ARAG 10.3]|uniref:flagellar biosynthetic protein FliO n=1 Tax=Cellvibrio sp. ARAG 10.3 TaxID=3451358 RepID=UPI003F48236E
MNPIAGKNLRARRGALLVAGLLVCTVPAFADSEPTAPDVNQTTPQEAAAPVVLPSTETSSAAPSSTALSSTTAPSTQTAPVVEKKAGQGATRISSSTHLANVAMGLVFIVALILVLGWFLRRFNQGGLFNNSSIKIIASLPLGTRERLAVVDVGGQQLLLGITATQINTLHVFNEPILAPGDTSPAASDFGKKLMTLLQQKNDKTSADSADKTAL